MKNYYKEYEHKSVKPKTKHTADLYEQFIDHHPKAKNPKKLVWTPEDQALEDILWAS